MRVFLDTNVILDTLITGRPSSETSSKLVDRTDMDAIRFSVSALSLADAAYTCRKFFSREAILDSIEIIRHRWRVLHFSEYNIYDALKSDCPDFEDAIQISIAESDADVIVTNDVRHFKGYTALEVVTPQEFLERISAD